MLCVQMRSGCWNLIAPQYALTPCIGSSLSHSDGADIIDPATGEWVDNYTMLTMNANVHPLMNRLHKPELDTKTKLPLPAEKQDKRSLVLIEYQDVDRWLKGTLEDAKGLVRLTQLERFAAGPHLEEAGIPHM